MISKATAVQVILAEAAASLMSRKDNLTPADVELLDALWRCAYTSHTVFNEEVVEIFATVTNYGGEMPTIEGMTEEQTEDFTKIVQNGAKWIGKWGVMPEITERLEAEAAEKKRLEDEAKAEAKVKAEQEKKAKAEADAKAKEEADAKAATDAKPAQTEVKGSKKKSA